MSAILQPNRGHAVIDLLLAQYVAVATPFYEYGKWLIEQSEPYLPLGKLEEFVPHAREETNQ